MAVQQLLSPKRLLMYLESFAKVVDPAAQKTVEALKSKEHVKFFFVVSHLTSHNWRTRGPIIILVPEDSYVIIKVYDCPVSCSVKQKKKRKG